MADDPDPAWKRLPLALRLTDEELSLVRWIGTRMSRLLMGRYEDLPVIERQDELGIVTNLVARVVGELRAARARDEKRRQELKGRVEELERAREEQKQLLQEIRVLSSPMIVVAPGVLLVPMAGVLSREMLSHAETRILPNIVSTHSRIVILDVTGAPVIERTAAEGLMRIARSVALLGAQAILCGISAQAAHAAVDEALDFAPALICANLSKAIALALGRVRQ